jgi:hypothetical protein
VLQPGEVGVTDEPFWVSTGHYDGAGLRVADRFIDKGEERFCLLLLKQSEGIRTEPGKHDAAVEPFSLNR